MENTEIRLNPTQVANELGICVQTMDRWYKWASLHPENPLSQILPKPTRGGKGRFGARTWSLEDLEKLREFKSNVKQGKAGIMGEVTQRYIHKDNEPKTV